MTDEDTMNLNEGDIVLVACRVIRSNEVSMDGEDGLLDIDGELRVDPIFGTALFYVEPHSVVQLPYQPEISINDAEGWEMETEWLSKAIKKGGEA